MFFSFSDAGFKNFKGDGRMFLKTLAASVLSALSLVNPGTISNSNSTALSTRNTELTQRPAVAPNVTNFYVPMRNHTNSEVLSIINESEEEGKKAVEKIYGSRRGYDTYLFETRSTWQEYGYEVTFKLYSDSSSDVKSSNIKLAVSGNFSIHTDSIDYIIETFNKKYSSSYTRNNFPLKEVVIDSGITDMIPGSFSGLYELQSVTIPSSVDRIFPYTFQSCIGLSSVVIPDSVRSIGSEAFGNCVNLVSIKLPSSLTTIERSAFEGCASLNSVELPSSLTTIGLEAFKNCESLTSISIPPLVTNIEYGAFEGCKSLKNLKLPSAATYIGDGAFRNCTSLSEVVIPSTVTYIGDDAFRDCVILSKVVIPSTATYIGDNAFDGCNVLVNANYCGVYDIGKENVFANNISKVKVPTTYVDTTFCGKEVLKRLTEGDICEYIPDVPYPSEKTKCGKAGDSYYRINGGVLEISGTGEMCSFNDKDSFPWSRYMNDIQTIEVKEGVTKISAYAFKDFTNLQKVIIASSVADIGEKAFSGCSNLNDVKYCGIQTINSSDSVFEGCNYLNKVNVNENYQDENFCYKQVEKKLDDQCEAIPDPSEKQQCKSYDENNNNITSYWSLKDGVLIISGDDKMCGSGAMSMNKFPWHKYANDIETIIIENGITKISEGAFAGLTNLVNVVIPNSVRSIGSNAFEGCTSLNSVIIPGSVRSIGFKAFGGCKNLSNVKYCGAGGLIQDSSYYYVFEDCYALSQVDVPYKYDDSVFCGIGVRKVLDDQCEINPLPIDNGVLSRTKHVFPIAAGLTAGVLALQRHIKI